MLPLSMLYFIKCVIMVVSKLDSCCLFPLCLRLRLLRISSGVNPFSADTKLNKMMIQPKVFQKIPTAARLLEMKFIHRLISEFGKASLLHSLHLSLPLFRPYN